ncbi:tRNA synthetases class I (M)-domain-containing protein [Kockovaella imperatae]|uniref:methionine--tRNA ligase n=1 Tax=Kockovaella imperatae TaxID=4999 RepID=A0A1Y1UIF9_9TREE|nr:tRNA synthetases class I (M)-domain-containing protein [Kockovaella imperatae]ORX36885.1 tRNA synthetases class I (M)-domain-containing protein [Kockovaella imperatae]
MRRHVPLAIKNLRSGWTASCRPLQSVPLRCSESTIESVSTSSSLGIPSDEYNTRPIASSSRLPPPPSILEPLTSDDFTKPLYITSPIFDVDGLPHLGHLHALIIADVLARYSRLRYPDRDVRLVVGTNELGPAVSKAAQKAKAPPIEYASVLTSRFRLLMEESHIEPTDFVFTTKKTHQAAVTSFLDILSASEDLYPAYQIRWYSRAEGRYIPNHQLETSHDGSTTLRSTGEALVRQEVKVWMFRLSNYRDALQAWIDMPLALHPPMHRIRILGSFLSLSDVPVSHPAERGETGIPVPNDPSQMIDSSFSSLISYISSLGYPNPSEVWPADVHIIGKGRLKSHALLWPALLLSIGVEPPRSLLVTNYWTKDGEKMSREVGRPVDPRTLLRFYGVDAVRWHLMRSGGYLNRDTDFNIERLESDYDFLCSNYGHLLNRISSRGAMDKATGTWLIKRDPNMESMIARIKDVYCQHMDKLELSKACDLISDLILQANKTFIALGPFRPSGTDTKLKAPDTSSAIYYAYHALRISSILMRPFMPLKSMEMLDRLWISASERGLDDAVITFANDSTEIDVRRTIEVMRDGMQFAIKCKLPVLFKRLHLKKNESILHGRLVSGP